MAEEDRSHHQGARLRAMHISQLPGGGLSPSVVLLGCFLESELVFQSFREPRLVVWMFSAASYFITPPSVTAFYDQRAAEGRRGLLLL